MALHMFIGPMFSGKTSTMAFNLSKMHLNEKLIIKYKKDDRFTDKDIIVTHNKMEYGHLNTVSCSDLVEVDKIVEKKGIEAIGVDEIQFFENHMKVVDWAKKGLFVFVAGLDGDYKQDPFNSVYELIPHCDSIKKLRAMCLICKSTDVNAIYTTRKGEDKERVIVGGEDLYSVCCRKCKQ